MVQSPAGSLQGLPRCVRCVVSCGSTSPWLVFFFGALLWRSMIHKIIFDFLREIGVFYKI